MFLMYAAAHMRVKAYKVEARATVSVGVVAAEADATARQPARAHVGVRAKLSEDLVWAESGRGSERRGTPARLGLHELVDSRTLPLLPEAGA